MATRKAVLTGSALLTVAQGISFVSSFVRNIIFARLLTKADFGVAATFAMVIALLEFTAKCGLERQVVQAKDGESRNFVGTAHAAQAMIGIASALAMLAVAPGIARLFDSAAATGAFRWLAVIPLARAFLNLNVNRMMRDMRFGAFVLVEAVPQVIVTLAAWPMAIWLKDYRSLLILLVARWLLVLLCTHFLADRPYRLRLDKKHLPEMVGFGWPLVVNSMLIFGITQGDRLIVGISHTMADLGVYSVAAQITIVPTMMLCQTVASLLLPIMSRVQDEAKQFFGTYRLCAHAIAGLATAFAAAVILAGEPIVRLTFGQKYAGIGQLLTYLVAAQALRIMRVPPTLGAMAKGDTKNIMLANAARLGGLVPAIMLGVRGAPITHIALAGLAGEAAAWITSVFRFCRQHGVCIKDGSLPTLAALSLVAASTATKESGIVSPSLGASLLMAGLFVAISIGVTLASSTELRKHTEEMAGAAVARLRGSVSSGGIR